MNKIKAGMLGMLLACMAFSPAVASDWLDAVSTLVLGDPTASVYLKEKDKAEREKAKETLQIQQAVFEATENSLQELKEADSAILYNVSEQEAKKLQFEAQKYMTKLARLVRWGAASNHPYVDVSYYKLLVHQSYPIFRIFGGLSEQDRAWAVAGLRQDLERYTHVCSEKGNPNSCDKLLSAANALILLSKGNPQDVSALNKLFERGFNSPYASKVITTAGAGMLSLGGDRELIAALIKADKEFNSRHWKGVLPTIHAAVTGAHDGSLYPIKEGDKRLRSAWSDLGTLLGLETLKGNLAAKNVLHTVMSRFVTVNREGVFVVTFPQFVQGVLASGYQLDEHIADGVNRDELDANGKIHHVDTRDTWAQVRATMEEQHQDLTGFTIAWLYNHPMDDLNAESKAMVRQELLAAYFQKGKERPELNGMKEMENLAAVKLTNHMVWTRGIQRAGFMETGMRYGFPKNFGLAMAKKPAQPNSGMLQLGRLETQGAVNYRNVEVPEALFDKDGNASSVINLPLPIVRDSMR